LTHPVFAESILFESVHPKGLSPPRSHKLSALRFTCNDQAPLAHP
jgi:hypothetical protein